jgi:hypothetical protein
MRADDELIKEIDSVLAGVGFESDPAFMDYETPSKEEQIRRSSEALNQRGPELLEARDFLFPPVRVGAATRFALANGGTSFPQRRVSAWRRFWTRIGNWVTG